MLTQALCLLRVLNLRLHLPGWIPTRAHPVGSSRESLLAEWVGAVRHCNHKQPVRDRAFDDGDGNGDCDRDLLQAGEATPAPVARLSMTSFETSSHPPLRQEQVRIGDDEVMMR